MLILFRGHVLCLPHHQPGPMVWVPRQTRASTQVPEPTPFTSCRTLADILPSLSCILDASPGITLEFSLPLLAMPPPPTCFSGPFKVALRLFLNSTIPFSLYTLGSELSPDYTVDMDIQNSSSSVPQEGQSLPQVRRRGKGRSSLGLGLSADSICRPTATMPTTQYSHPEDSLPAEITPTEVS